MTKVELSSAFNRPHVYILSESTDSNPYKQNLTKKRSTCTICFIVIVTFVVGLMIGHESSAASPYVDSMLKKGNDYVAKIEVDESVDFSNNAYMTARAENFDSWFEGDSTDKLLENADEKGPIIDFAVVGFSRCVKPLVSKLAGIAAMPVDDACTPTHQTVFYAYKNWPEKYGAEKLLKGTVCGSYIGQESVQEWSKYLPRTKLIIGIAHPMTWFKEFWDHLSRTGYIKKMTKNNDPYELTKLCVGNKCRKACPNNQVFCLHGARFHLGLAKLGKTPLSDEERKLLAPDDQDGGTNLVSDGVKNPIFLYDEGELTHDYAWEGLADFLGVESIHHSLDPPNTRESAQNIVSLDFCDEKYDELRSMIMPYSYDLGAWLQTYFLPAATDNNRPDVRVANPERFSKAVESYKSDPCGTLVRAANGTFVIQPN